ncbi:unnamed protein product, partial [Polarella glacialis]
RSALAFNIYDLDGDGIISMSDAVSLSKEESRLALMYGDDAQSKPVCQEMRWLYGIIANTMDSNGAGLDLHMFQQACPESQLGAEL